MFNKFHKIFSFNIFSQRCSRNDNLRLDFIFIILFINIVNYLHNTISSLTNQFISFIKYNCIRFKTIQSSTTHNSLELLRCSYCDICLNIIQIILSINQSQFFHIFFQKSFFLINLPYFLLI